MKKIKAASSWLRGKNKKRIIGASTFMVAFAIIGIALLIRSLAAGEALYLTPVTSSVQTGSDVTVTLRVNGGDGINAIDTYIDYDQTKLQFKSINESASGFNNGLFAENENGRVHIARLSTVTGGVRNDVELASVTFTAIATTAGATNLTVSGQAASAVSDDAVNLVITSGSVNITVPQAPTNSASYTIESTVAAPIVNAQFGLRVYVTSNAFIQGGEVVVNLPTGLAYQSPLNKTGTVFNPVEAVNGTTAQQVRLVFVTQSATLTGKQLVATIPVTATTAGAKSITFTGSRVADTDSADITPVTANPFSITVNSASIPAPTVTMPGKTQLASSENITDLRQGFTITNFDSAATYSVTLGGQNINLTGNAFAIPASTRNADLALLVSVTKDGASGNASYTIRLRNPNVNRTACVELSDLLVVNQGYGGQSIELDLNFDGTVGLIDLLTVTGGWGGSCI